MRSEAASKSTGGPVDVRLATRTPVAVLLRVFISSCPTSDLSASTPTADLASLGKAANSAEASEQVVESKSSDG